MNKKLIKMIALSAFAIGGGITTLASTSCGSSTPSPDPDHTGELYELKLNECIVSTGNTTFTGITYPVLQKIKEGKYDGFKLPTDSTLTIYEPDTNFWNDIDYIKTIELPSNITKCCGYYGEGKCSHCFPCCETKLIIDATSIEFDYGNHNNSIFDQATKLDTIEFANISSSSNVTIISVSETDKNKLLANVGNSTDQPCKIVSSSMSDLSTLLSNWKSTYGLPGKWTNGSTPGPEERYTLWYGYAPGIDDNYELHQGSLPAETCTNVQQTSWGRFTIVDNWSNQLLDPSLITDFNIDVKKTGYSDYWDPKTSLKDLAFFDDSSNIRLHYTPTYAVNSTEDAELYLWVIKKDHTDWISNKLKLGIYFHEAK